MPVDVKSKWPKASYQKNVLGTSFQLFIPRRSTDRVVHLILMQEECFSFRGFLILPAVEQ